MKNREKTLPIYCSKDSFLIHHLTNHLMSAELPYMITGETATIVFGVENITQEICIRVFESDVIKAKHILAPYIPDGE